MKFDYNGNDNNNSSGSNDMQYSKGGGGDGGPNFGFTVKKQIFSRQCHSDPNNPGQMICKETNNSSGYDPFNKDKVHFYVFILEF